MKTDLYESPSFELFARAALSDKKSVVVGLPGRVGVVVAVAVRRQLVDVDHDGIRCFRTFWRTCSNDRLVDQPLAGELVVPDVVFELNPLVPGGRLSDIRTFRRTSSVGRAFSGTRQAR